MKKLVLMFAGTFLTFASFKSGAAENRLWECTANKNIDSAPTYGQPKVPYPKVYITSDGADYYVGGKYPNGTPGFHVQLSRTPQDASKFTYSDGNVTVLIGSDQARIFITWNPYSAYDCAKCGSAADCAL